MQRLHIKLRLTDGTEIRLTPVEFDGICSIESLELFLQEDKAAVWTDIAYFETFIDWQDGALDSLEYESTGPEDDGSPEAGLHNIPRGE